MEFKFKLFNLYSKLLWNEIGLEKLQQKAENQIEIWQQITAKRKNQKQKNVKGEKNYH